MSEQATALRARQWGPEFLGGSELASIIGEGLEADWLLGASFHELRLRLGESRGDAIGAALELGRRASMVPLPREILSDPDAVANWAICRLAHLRHEELWLLSTDARGGLLSARKVAQGSVHGLSVRIADILRSAIREGASGFLLVHNHPGGDPTPSPEDLHLTANVAEAGAVLGVTLLDHLVVAGSAFYSILTRRRRDSGEHIRSEALDNVRSPPEETSSLPEHAPVEKQRRSIRRR